MPWKQSEESIQSGESAQFPSPALRKDEFWAVRDVSFEVKRGECLGLIGHNGAGKSTLLKMLNSLNRPDAGRITMRGRVGALIELNADVEGLQTAIDLDAAFELLEPEPEPAPEPEPDGDNPSVASESAEAEASELVEPEWIFEDDR